MVIDLRLLGVFAAIISSALAPFALAEPLHDAAQSGSILLNEKPTANACEAFDPEYLR